MTSTDEQLISRLRPVLLAGLPQSAHPVQVHAETLHQLSLTEGLLEVLEWSREGTAADPLACMWLASLRWYRLIRGALPNAAPAPPQRPVDRGLALLMRSKALTVLPGSADASAAGLASGSMAYPSSPAQPEELDDGVVLRVVPIGMVPFIDEPMRISWVRQAVGLTHGHPDLLEAAHETVSAVHQLSLGLPAETEPLLSRLSPTVAGTLTAQLDAAKTGCPPRPPQQDELLSVVVHDLADRWETVNSVD